jgi:hypothetical protein
MPFELFAGGPSGGDAFRALCRRPFRGDAFRALCRSPFRGDAFSRRSTRASRLKPLPTTKRQRRNRHQSLRRTSPALCRSPLQGRCFFASSPKRIAAAFNSRMVGQAASNTEAATQGPSLKPTPRIASSSREPPSGAMPFELSVGAPSGAMLFRELAERHRARRRTCKSIRNSLRLSVRDPAIS